MVTLDGLEEEAFRRSIETQLRHGWAGDALVRLRRLLGPYAAPGSVLPERFLTVTTDDVTLVGWENLAASMRQYDRPGRPITAMQIAFGWAGDDAPAPDAAGRLAPYLEVAYYSDQTFPFSQSTRDDLLEGYSYHGCTWSGDAVGIETPLSLTGIDDLNGALALLEAELLAMDEPDEEKIAAGSLGACLLSALLFKAVGERIARDPLPRALCVTSGSSGVYPYFDAPVVGLQEEAIKAARIAEIQAMADVGVPGPRYSSLLVTSIPRARKRAVLVLEEGADETAHRLATLRGQTPPEAEAPAAPAAPQDDWAEPAVPVEPEIPAPGGPLLAKKPARPAHEHGTMPGSLITVTHHAREIDPIAVPVVIEERPVQEAAPEVMPDVTVAFDMQERLQLLVAKNAVQPAPSAGLARPVITPASPAPAVEAEVPPAGPALRFDAEWQDEPAPVPARERYEARGLFSGLGQIGSRIRNWWQGR